MVVFFGKRDVRKLPIVVLCFSSLRRYSFSRRRPYPSENTEGLKVNPHPQTLPQWDSPSGQAIAMSADSFASLGRCESNRRQAVQYSHTTLQKCTCGFLYP